MHGKVKMWCSEQNRGQEGGRHAAGGEARLKVMRGDRAGENK